MQQQCKPCTVFQTLTNLEKSGELKLLFRSRALAASTYSYYEIYQDFDRHRRTGAKVMQSVRKACDNMRVGENTVYRAKKMMETK